MDESLLDTLTPVQRLALSYAPRAVRSDTLALLALNARLAGIVRAGGEPVIAQMKFAWWRDMLARPKQEWPLGEPLLELLRKWRGDVTALGRLVDGWEGLLAETLGETEIAEFGEGHAAAWSALGERQENVATRTAATQAALGDLSLHLGDPAEKALVMTKLGAFGSADGALPRTHRPLALLRGLTLRALHRGSSEVLDGPGALAAAIRLGFTGR